MKIHHAADLSNLPAIAHGFFGREGGVSQGVYASLNCGPGSRDAPKAVTENRARAVAALGPGLRLITLGQIHSAIVHPVGPAWDFDVKQEGDALVTDQPGLALGILTADCAPVLFADAEARVIGAAHAGWKGAVAGVLENTVAVMEKLGAKPDRIVAAIGPAISQANYEVGADMRARFGAADERFFMSGRAGHFHFDLPGYAAHRLRQAGVGKIADLGLCTYPMEEGFFSFRRTTHRGEADYGRELSAIALMPEIG
jgi:purine-nucleoside/S-methyl-5'-thioadenosine phosphorylase / adenosine deaminase